MSYPLDETAGLLRDAQHVVALTGAGISKESGLPTFREAQTGLWARYRPEDLATPQAFARDPRLVWQWYAWRRGLVRSAEPNAAHHALVDLARRVPRFTLVTQNVDGLHLRAGSTDVVELHGDIMRSRCSACGRAGEDDLNTPAHAAQQDGKIAETDGPPPCAHCGAPLRPDVVWFGESLPGEALNAAFEAAAVCDVLLSIGTSLLVQPAASLVPTALRAGAAVISVNPDAAMDPHPRVYQLAGSAAELLPALVMATWPA